MARDNYDNTAYTADYFSQYDSTISNGEARIPICFCVDTSSSMNFITNRPGDYTTRRNSSHTEDGISNVVTVDPLPGKTLYHRIEEVRRVLAKMLDRIRSDSIIRNAAVICIVTFDQFADCILEFSELYRINDYTIQQIRTHVDKTNISKGIDMSLERLDQFARINNNAGNESFRPVLIVMSDGSVREDREAERAKREVRQRSEDDILNVIPIGIGDSADEVWLRQLSKDSHVYHMTHEDEFDRVFEIITRRIEKAVVVLPADEAMMESTQSDVVPLNDETSTQYGAEVTGDDIADFLAEFANS